ncbi:hypothetical protein H4O05_20880 [Citrobacter freundii]|uniref:hypothetical protein n=1 Tax=Citrobacter freundii TaxID=546 RepID=UPI0016286DD3|nr:hypothetical protein [Citrobacter freundii]ELK7203434.1 hypothetical protein [Citrobacter freundii]MDT7382482.1 hypothetical protein [Citrobacter freundii]UNM02647.1 hypothetical protein H4O05_20880 [Citrobacter freundii]
MNSLTYLEWMKHLPKDDGSYSSCECPACGKKGLSYQYFGFDNGDIGWKVIWCETCKSGVKISRTKIPEGASRLIDFQEQGRFFETKPELKLIV